MRWATLGYVVTPFQKTERKYWFLERIKKKLVTFSVFFSLVCVCVIINHIITATTEAFTFCCFFFYFDVVFFSVHTFHTAFTSFREYLIVCCIIFFVDSILVASENHPNDIHRPHIVCMCVTIMEKERTKKPN